MDVVEQSQSMGGGHPLFNSCLGLLSNSDDSKKFAALLLATKLEGISHQQYVQLFGAIGNKFLLRLMKSQHNSRESLLLGLSIIDSFSRVSSVRLLSEFRDLLRSLSPVFHRKKSLFLDDDEASKSSIAKQSGKDDGPQSTKSNQPESNRHPDHSKGIAPYYLSLCSNISQDDSGCELLLSKDFCLLLWEIAVARSKFDVLTTTTASCVDVVVRCFSTLSRCPFVVKTDSPVASIRDLLFSNTDHFVSTINDSDEPVIKLALCHRLIRLLEVIDDRMLSDGDNLVDGCPRSSSSSSSSWVSGLATVIKGILLSRSMSPDNRELSFVLASHLSRITNNLDWLKEDDGNSSSKFFLILLRLSCLELQILFDRDSLDAICLLWQKRKLVAVVSSLIERLIGWSEEEIAGRKKMLSEDQYDQMRLSHIALFDAINDFIVSQSAGLLSRFTRPVNNNTDGEREQEMTLEESTKNDDELSGFAAVVRLYGFLANDEEIAQTEEFVKGVSVLFKVEERLCGIESSSPNIESDSSSLNAETRLQSHSSLLDFLTPGLFLLSLDAEFFDDVSGDIGFSLVRLYRQHSSFASSSPSLESSLTTSSSFPTAIFAIFLNLASFHPSHSIGAKLRSSLLDSLSDDTVLISYVDQPVTLNLRICYVSTLILKLTSHISPQEGDDEMEKRRKGVAMSVPFIRNTFINELHPDEKKVFLPNRDIDGDWETVVEQLFIDAVESCSVLVGNPRFKFCLDPHIREVVTLFRDASPSASISSRAVDAVARLRAVF